MQMSRALIVIDVQREYFDGALPISYPTGHLEQILRVMDEATKAGLPVAVIRHHQSAADSPIFRLNSDMWQLHPEVEQLPRSVLIDKQLPGAFTNTELNAWLQSVGADTVCIAGYMTHMCCDTTARQAFHRGYQVEFLNDATGTLDVENEAGKATAQELQNSILVAQQMFISQILNTEHWLERITATAS
jgi:nicotinamidase-related amidase